LKEQLSHLDNSSEEMDILRQQEKAAREKALKKASELNALRLKAAQKAE
jgi:DNA repair ATPase RecN